MERPERKIVLDVKIQADSWEDIASVFEALSDRIDREGPITQLVSGGYSSGYSVTGKVNPEQTGENYRAQNDEYVKQLRSERT